MNRRALLRRISQGAVQNVRMADFEDLVRGVGFSLVRTSGSHRIYAHGDIPELVNIQDASGDAKPYQIRQFLRLVERYNLQLRDDG